MIETLAILAERIIHAARPYQRQDGNRTPCSDIPEVNRNIAIKNRTK